MRACANEWRADLYSRERKREREKETKRERERERGRANREKDYAVRGGVHYRDQMLN